ncbi:thioredoxin [Pseudomonas frederiksbergensis]|uniref:thioredoxin n=1 Tax=Pseudomonas frederiksbergensis TaxID=104087 RepID=UPI000F481EA7|nr:thioredoxin [Pseudomonas frederiksbergensis]RON56254.1 thioredoxin [Pseudomonas frederiksbergensis]
MTNVINVSDASFENDVLKSAKPVLVHFWAEWSTPCKMIAPSIEQLADEYYGRVLIAKMNIDENPNTGVSFGIRDVPTLLVIKNGELVAKQVGAAPKNRLSALIDANIQND